MNTFKRVIGKGACVLVAGVLLLCSGTLFAGAGTGQFQIVKVQLFGNGNLKIYTNKSSVNGMENCSATDQSIAIEGSSPMSREFLAIALTGQATGATVQSWVEGCCVTHSGKQSPCIWTLNLE